MGTYSIMKLHTKVERKRIVLDLSTKPDGFTTDEAAEAMGVDYESAKNMLKGMATRGAIIRSRVWGAEGRRHYFDTEAREAEWSARNQGYVRRAVIIQAQAFEARQKQASKRAEFTASNADGQPAVQRAKVIYGDVRYQIQPGEEVPKLFRKLPLGATLYGMTA